MLFLGKVGKEWVEEGITGNYVFARGIARLAARQPYVRAAVSFGLFPSEVGFSLFEEGFDALFVVVAVVDFAPQPLDALECVRRDGMGLRQ